MSSPLTPEEFVHRVELVLPLSTAKEQQHLLTHARAWATVSHNGDVPQELTNRIDNLEAHYAHSR